MKRFIARIDGKEKSLPTAVLCDAWLADDLRFGDELRGLDSKLVVGRWPEELDIDAAVRLAQAVGESYTWEDCVVTPAVAQKLAERARPQPLDLEIGRHLQHLQHVCYKPRLHLRVEEERLPVSRARRTPVRAIADLMSHPGDWEHRTLKSIQPSRVLARQIEDEWNLYENRVAARLVDHLLAYLAKRLEELRKIKESLDASRDHSDELRRTSFRRAERITMLWSNTLESKTEEELNDTINRLELAQRNLQTLLDSPLCKQIPRHLSVSVSLKPTNILVNDTHYRKVAALWRSWVKYGHKRQETTQERTTRRQQEASAWDRFVLHLVVRGFSALGWTAKQIGAKSWECSKIGWLSVQVRADEMGMIHVKSERVLQLLPLCDVKSERVLQLLPLCANLAAANPDAVLAHIKALDAPHQGAGAEVVIAHVGGSTALSDTDRAAGWSFGGRAVLFACSPWEIDSEERMTRVLHGWLNRAAVRIYPAARSLCALPSWPGRRDWLRYEDDHLVAFRAPTNGETFEARAWANSKIKDLETQAQRAKAAKQAFEIAPLKALEAFQAFVLHATEHLTGLGSCPVCDGQGRVEVRPGKRSDGSDATWWAICTSCKSEWGSRSCAGCASRYRALMPQIGSIDLMAAAQTTRSVNWPDKIFGHDLWAQPCQQQPSRQFRCPDCGRCSDLSCVRCFVDQDF
jgi:hypothetical protein